MAAAAAGAPFIDLEAEIVVIGGGPTGLGAGYRLTELKHKSWLLLEESPEVGGLASTVFDEAGFMWDLGIHAICSHYDYYDRMMDSAIPAEEWTHQVRAAYVWMRDRFIPYPMQNNLWLLPDEEVIACLESLLDMSQQPPSGPAKNFEEWMLQRFGRGLCDVFMIPYNRKVWAIEPAGMCTEWMGDRVATVDLRRILRNLVTKKVETNWGPNATFRYPLHGGSGAIWKGVGSHLPAANVVRGARVVGVNTTTKVLTLQDGRHVKYQHLISTMPMDILIRAMEDKKHLLPIAPKLRYSAVHLIGLGMEGPVPPHMADKYWMYLPENNTPAFRCTVFSNLSPYAVPKPGQQWSLLCEVAESVDKHVDASTVMEDVIAGMKNVKFITDADVIVSKWYMRLDHGYPTPFYGRDELVHGVDAELKQCQILSRGRFGGWKYEVANQDHSAMQGVEAVDFVLEGKMELTYYKPDLVNTTRTR